MDRLNAKKFARLRSTLQQQPPAPQPEGLNMPTLEVRRPLIPIICRATVNGGGPSRMPVIPKANQRCAGEQTQ